MEAESTNVPSTCSISNIETTIASIILRKVPSQLRPATMADDVCIHLAPTTAKESNCDDESNSTTSAHPLASESNIPTAIGSLKPKWQP